MSLFTMSSAHRLSLSDLLLTVKAVYASACESRSVPHCTCVRGEMHKVLQWWMNSNPPYSVWLINVASSVQKPVWFSFRCDRVVNLGQLSFQVHTISSGLIRTDHIQLAGASINGTWPRTTNKYMEFNLVLGSAGLEFPPGQYLS